MDMNIVMLPSDLKVDNQFIAPIIWWFRLSITCFWHKNQGCVELR